MKIIALLPFKNESRFLASYLSSISKCCDALIAVDDGSVDGGKEILEASQTSKFAVSVHSKKQQGSWSVHQTRQDLLDFGRAAGGTHFVCLDADETFTAPFLKKFPKVLSSMKPGDKISMQWLAVWKSLDHYRNDASVWSNNYKDFIFCDDGTSSAHMNFLCEGRTPGENNETNLLKLNPKYGAVLHWQFSDWQAFQEKQCWYRCQELVLGEKSAAAINQKYSITLDDNRALVEPIPESWLSGITCPKPISLARTEQSWHVKEIAELFTKHGVEPFMSLDIWHVHQIKNLVK